MQSMRFMPDFHVRRPAGGRAVQIVNPADLSSLSASYVCPLDGALALHDAWPESRLVIVPDAGHAATEPGIADALIRATDEFADLLAKTDDPAERAFKKVTTPIDRNT